MNDPLRGAVAARRPVDARERDSIEAFLDAYDQLISPFSQDLDSTHVTASAIVVGERGVVLHRHKRLGIWLQPGGHIDAGESPADAASRETTEETGLTVTLVDGAIVHVDVHPGPRGHRHLDVRFLFGAPPVDPTPGEGESQDVRWFGWAEAIAIADVGLEGVLRAQQPGEPVLRRAEPDDARGMAAVHRRARRLTTPALPEFHDLDEVAAWIGDRIVGRTETGDELWVGDLDGVIVAEMILGRTVTSPGDDRPLRWLDHLYLDPAWLGRGLGDRLLAVAIELAPDGLQLWTHEINVGAQRFYERHGFTVAERTDGAANEERMPDLRYTRLP